MKILFLVKKNSYGSGVKSGLLNSAKLTAEMLPCDTRVRVCIDSNSIDRELSLYKPDICIIEAIWVTREKFIELQKHHPQLPFVVRVHSEIAFLAMEGEALNRIFSYSSLPNVYTAFNSEVTRNNFGEGLYLPNVYSETKKVPIYLSDLFPRPLNQRRYSIGCFGAIRPLKNTLLQAFAAIEFGDRYNKDVSFHINSSRVEQGGDPVLKNIRALFKNSPHTLVEHPWMERSTFLELLSHMDITMQLSFTESFNIVTADAISQRTPTIVSPTIAWMPHSLKTSSESAATIAEDLKYVLTYKRLFVKQATNALSLYNETALNEWIKTLHI